jgi:hypothetical protein
MSGVRLQSSHLYLDAEIVRELFGTANKVDMVYYPERNSLLLCATDKEFFHKMHKTKLVNLKDRNLKGDKTITLQELLIDNDIDDTDRDLEYNIRTETKILNVRL